MPNLISEDHIEQALLRRLKERHKFEILKCYCKDPDDLSDGSRRADKRDVILLDRVKEAAVSLNKKIPESIIDEALERLADRRQAMSQIAANREIYELLRDGVPVEFDDVRGQRQKERVRLIDFNKPDRNRFLAVSQLWVKGELRFRRPDVLLYINGIPLVFIELKNSNIKLKNAYDENITNYRKEIPQLFLTNALCVLSNGIESKVGSFTAEWEHFFNWLRVNDEKEKIDRKRILEEGTSLERIAEGLFDPDKLLDYVENFILYYKENQKIIAQNHQFIGVNRAYSRFLERKQKGAKLGVFWHTQGSGKSFSMIFYSRKIFRKQTGNFTFLIVTDREDLDAQIYRNFLNTGTVSKADAAQPRNSEEMRKFLSQNKRLVFTLIHKFRWPKGKAYPKLSARDDIIVIVDEAHRTQYRALAENMRAGLPNAQYLAFTGTPLLGRKRKTNAWFGDYVSEYNFQQSMEDGATLPLFYTKRVPQVLIQNEELSNEFYEILEDENLDDAEQEKLEKKFAKEMEVIKRDDRLETIATDIVYHFPRRGYLGKGILVSLDKFTAVKMYEKVSRLWHEHIKDLLGTVRRTNDYNEKRRLRKIVDYMRAVEMAVVISEDAGEEEKFRKQKLQIKPHRDRINRVDEHGHDIEYNFKDEEHPLQLVFVCAMWLTGFDAPTVSTMYMDKPMKDHTLMQTIARANRVTAFKIGGVEKKNGELVDYYNVFRNMKRALKDYAQGEEGLAIAPVQDKKELFQLLEDSIIQAKLFCQEKEIDLNALLESNDIFKKVSLFEKYADRLMTKEEWRKAFNVYENTATSLFEACKPEVLGNSIVRPVAVLQYLRGVMDSIIEQADIDSVSLRISDLLDESLVVEDSTDLKDAKQEFVIKQSGRTWDLSKLDFEKLVAEFKEATYKNIEIADLRAFIDHKLEQMLQQNATRSDFAQRLQEIVDRYNSGSSSADNYFDELVQFTKDLKEESERHIRENLTEDELELFDLLKKEKMTKEETQKVRLAAKSLLHRLLNEPPPVLIQDWFKDSQSKDRVKSTVQEVLNDYLPESYDRALFTKKCETVFELMVNYASQGLKWAA
jgi:type I restriction enzyme, R subunit